MTAKRAAAVAIATQVSALVGGSEARDLAWAPRRPALRAPPDEAPRPRPEPLAPARAGFGLREGDGPRSPCDFRAPPVVRTRFLLIVLPLPKVAQHHTGHSWTGEGVPASAPRPPFEDAQGGGPYRPAALSHSSPPGASAAAPAGESHACRST